MNRAEFKTALLAAIAREDQRRGVDAIAVAQGVLPGVSFEWVSEAVETFEGRGWVKNVSRGLADTIGLMITGECRQAAGER